MISDIYYFSMEQIEFEESLKRIADTLIQPNPIVRDSIVLNEVSDRQPYLANATVLYVVVKSEEDSPQAMQSFLSGVTKIAMAHKNCKDVICEDDRLVIIYSTAFKEELNFALDDAARIRSLAMIVTKIGKQSGKGTIIVNIGMDFGIVELYHMGQDLNNRPMFGWRGPAIKNAKRNAEDANDELIISRTVWNNLTENSQILFTKQSAISENYRGKIINIMMNNWLTK